MFLRSVFLVMLLVIVTTSCGAVSPLLGDIEAVPTATVAGVLTVEATPASQVAQEPALIATTILPTIAPSTTPDLQPKIGGENEAVKSLGTSTTYLYGVQPGSPIAISHWVYGCSWLGVAGQVFDAAGYPVENLVVEAGGTLGEQPVLGLSLTGIESGYGPGGYEIELADHPIESYREVWVQLKDGAGQPLSPQIYLDTLDDCDQNLVILNFVEGALPQETFLFYFPVILR